MIKPLADNIPSDDGWGVEQALDIQWSHAMAPYASLILIQAVSDSIQDLHSAIDYAVSINVDVISMSFGNDEFVEETSLDYHFNVDKNIVFCAGAGDTLGVLYPSASPYVLSVGGTRMYTKSKQDDNKKYKRGIEEAWVDNDIATGGGLSAYEPKPCYQKNIPLIASYDNRGTPDVSFLADPVTGVSVYDSFYGPIYSGGPWIEIGGTSLSSPCWAGIIACVNEARIKKQKKSLSNKQLADKLYDLLQPNNQKIYKKTMRDIIYGNVASQLNNAQPGYDLLTGIGTPNVKALIKYLSK